ncbi:MAG: HAMP domain-containing histidine kinase [Thermoflexales bacterium]|nr:HAMP domain-containing histidine kinase [Thermoflexales bacterium]
MKRRWLLWTILIGFPLLAAFGAAIGLQHGMGSNPVFRLQVRADLGTWILLGNGVVTLILLLGVTGFWGAHYLRRQVLANAQREYSLSRRRFIRHLEHELKNPLAIIRAQLTYLSERAEGVSPERILSDILIQIERLSRLVAHLRQLVELEEQNIECVPVDVASLLCEVVEASQTHPNYEERQVHLLLPRAPWPLPAVNGDRDLLGLAFFNLLDNALKFTRPGDTIEIRAFENGRSVVVEVADTGPGIAEDDLPYIFEELYRGANARGYEGSGLGLALVRAIVKRHGGNVKVRSRLGQGTVFTVSLPIASWPFVTSCYKNVTHRYPADIHLKRKRCII